MVVIILHNFAIAQPTFCQSLYRVPQGSLMGWTIISEYYVFPDERFKLEMRSIKFIDINSHYNFPDILITWVPQSKLFHNNKKPAFTSPNSKPACLLFLPTTLSPMVRPTSSILPMTILSIGSLSTNVESTWNMLSWHITMLISFLGIPSLMFLSSWDQMPKEKSPSSKLKKSQTTEPSKSERSQPGSFPRLATQLSPLALSSKMKAAKSFASSLVIQSSSEKWEDQILPLPPTFLQKIWEECSSIPFKRSKPLMGNWGFIQAMEEDLHAANQLVKETFATSRTNALTTTHSWSKTKTSSLKLLPKIFQLLLLTSSMMQNLIRKGLQ